MVNMDIIITVAIGLILQAMTSQAFRLTARLERVCQGNNFTQECGQYNGGQAYIKLLSVTVMSNDKSEDIVYETMNNPERKCAAALNWCQRTIHNSTDSGVNDDYRYLYQYIASSCHGKAACNGSLPEYWELVDDPKDCGGQTQYFAGARIDIECHVGSTIQTVAPPPSTTPRTKPTTPTSTTPFPVVFAIYLSEMSGLEKVILGVAIGLAIAILIMLLIVLYCCEKYRNHKKLAKLLRMLGAPQAEEDVFDELDYGRKEAWRDEAPNLDALGEYTGVKPDEFLTLDKSAMVTSGQIMYEAPNGTVSKTTTCSTIDRLDRKTGKNMFVTNIYTGPIDYETEENLELEQRMAAALQYELDSGVHEENLI